MILPITTKLHNANLRTFGSKDKEEEEKTYTYTGSQISAIKGRSAGGAAMCTFLAALGLLSVATNKDEKNTSDSLNLVSKVYNDPNTKKDRFEVRDVNNDETPEIILTKKDGSQVAIDILTGQILKAEKEITFQ